MSGAVFSAAEWSAATGGTWLLPPTPTQTFGVYTDTRQPGEGRLFLALAGESFDAHDLLDKAVSGGAGALCIARSKTAKLPPDCPLPVLLTDDPLGAYQAIANFHRCRFPHLKLAAVTGSVGKTSVKEMLRAIFTEAAGADAVLYTLGNTNNQIGVPQNLLRLTSAHQYAVIEMGTNHFGEIAPLARCAAPNGALVNSIAPCHLEFLLSLEGVASEKSAVFSNLTYPEIAVIPEISAGNDILQQAAQSHNMFTFGKESGSVRCRYCGGDLNGSSFFLDFADGKSFKVHWKLSGSHQALNAAAAAALAQGLGVSPEIIAAGLANTELPGMRTKRTDIAGATYINDAYNANPGSMRASFAWLKEFVNPGNLILVLGEMRELGDFSAGEHAAILDEALQLFPQCRIVTIGQYPQRDNVRNFAVSVEAAEYLAGIVRQGDIVFAKGSRGIAVEKALPPEAQ